MFDGTDEGGTRLHGVRFEDNDQARAELRACVRAYLASDFDALDVLVRHASPDLAAISIVIASGFALLEAQAAHPDAGMGELKQLAEAQLDMLIEDALTAEADSPSPDDDYPELTWPGEGPHE